MASGQETTRSPRPDPSQDNLLVAKTLLRQTRQSALATLTTGGAPLNTLTSLAADRDGAPLLLLSTLSQHTKNLLRDARACLLLTSPPAKGDPLNRARLSLSGVIQRCAAPHVMRRFLSAHPKSGLYAGFADFAIYRMEIESGHYNGGFGKAGAFTPKQLLTQIEDADWLWREEETLLEQINAGAALSRLAPIDGARRRRWRAIALDPEGIDLASAALTTRFHFATPSPDLAAWRRLAGF